MWLDFIFATRFQGRNPWKHFALYSKHVEKASRSLAGDFINGNTWEKNSAQKLHPEFPKSKNRNPWNCQSQQQSLQGVLRDTNPTSGVCCTANLQFPLLPFLFKSCLHLTAKISQKNLLKVLFHRFHLFYRSLLTPEMGASTGIFAITVGIFTLTDIKSTTRAAFVAFITISLLIF